MKLLEDFVGNTPLVRLQRLPGQTSAGGRDTYLRKYDANGNEFWTRQFGTAGMDAGSE